MNNLILQIIKKKNYFLYFLIVNILNIKKPDSGLYLNQRHKSLSNLFNNLIKEDDLKIHIDAIDRMSGRDFELYVADIFSILGYEAFLTPETGDQGVDIILKKNDESIAVQTKRYSTSIGNSAVQEVIAGRIYYNCSRGIVITNNFYTRSAHELSVSDGLVELINRDGLEKLITLARKNLLIDSNK